MVCAELSNFGIFTFVAGVFLQFIVAIIALTAVLIRQKGP